MNAKARCEIRHRTTLQNRSGSPWLFWAKLVAAGLFVFGIGAAGFAQSFQNLGFETATLVPINSADPSRVQPGPAFRGWTVLWDQGAAPFVLYDNMALDSVNVSLVDTNFGYQFRPFQGRFTAILEGGFSWSGPPDRDSAAIAQTGLIPATAKTLLFDASAANVVVSIGGVVIPYYALASYVDYIQFGLDISNFAGQTMEIRFTANPTPPPGLAINIVYLDDIRFSSALPGAPPFILASPLSQTANASSNVDFAVSATGSPTPAYQWFFNSTNLIAGATSSHLQLTNVNFAQSGAYTVVLTNIYGTVTSQPTILTVRDPFIINQPTGKSVNAGQTASLFVTVGGTQPLTLQWLKDGAALHDGGVISGSATGVLSLNGVSGADAGGYSVVISNVNSSVTSSVATLMVKDPVIASQPVNQTVNIGGAAVFNVVAGGTEPFSYQWFNAGVSLNDGGGISGSRTATLTVANVVGSEADAYWVVASNSYGSVTSQVTFVSVTPPLYSILHEFHDFSQSVYNGNSGADLILSGTELYGTAEGWVFKINTDGTGFSRVTDLSDNGHLSIANTTLYGTFYKNVFKVGTDGSGFALLKSFTGGSDGGTPTAAPVLVGSVLYGTTYTGGSAGYGNVFKVNSDGSGFGILKDFDNTVHYPQGGLTLAGSTLYGTTSHSPGYGGVFKLNSDGSDFTVLKQFDGSDGNQPRTTLALGGATLYGTTYYGGPAYPSAGSGTVFKLNTNGSGFEVLRYFSGGSDGKNPAGDLVLSGSTLYGTTSSGGISNYGTVFKVDIDGNNYTILKRFRGRDGANPDGGLVASRGVLYGTTKHGGIANNGVVFALYLSVPPSIEVNPPRQTAEVGSDVTFRSHTSGYQPTYQWIFNGTTFLGDFSTNSWLRMTNVQFSQAGDYTVVAANAFASATSMPAMLNVIAPVKRRAVPGIFLNAQSNSLLDIHYGSSLTSVQDWESFPTLYFTNSPQYFFDLSSPLPSQRFYRASQVAPVSVTPSLGLHMIPALTLTGSPGDRIRVDGINQFGPTDAWFTLDTVMLTSISQFYFDVTAPGQPARLYRLVPVP